MLFIANFIAVIFRVYLLPKNIWEIHISSFMDTRLSYDSSIINLYTTGWKWSKNSESQVFWDMFQREWGDWIKSYGSKLTDYRYTDDGGSGGKNTKTICLISKF